MVVAGGHDGVEALYSTEVLMVESNGEFASKWCAHPRNWATSQYMLQKCIAIWFHITTVKLAFVVLCDMIDAVQLVSVKNVDSNFCFCINWSH